MNALPLRLIFALLVFVFPGSSGAYEPSYVSVGQVDFAQILPPSPPKDSSQQQNDFDAVLRAQAARSSAEADRAVKDNALSVEQIVDGILGENFTQERLPKFTAFYSRVVADTRSLFSATKNLWNRPRPFSVSSEVNAIGERPSTASYPSGHATRGWLTAILLSNMVPEKAAELFARGREYGDNRVVAGVHFPTDVEAGRLGATAIATALMQNENFRRDFNEAQTEVRQALGLSLLSGDTVTQEGRVQPTAQRGPDGQDQH